MFHARASLAGAVILDRVDHPAFIVEIGQGLATGRIRVPVILPCGIEGRERHLRRPRGIDCLSAQGSSRWAGRARWQSAIVVVGHVPPDAVKPVGSIRHPR